jgi:hypothetical protein
VGPASCVQPPLRCSRTHSRADFCPFCTASGAWRVCVHLPQPWADGHSGNVARDCARAMLAWSREATSSAHTARASHVCLRLSLRACGRCRSKPLATWDKKGV